MIFNISNNKNSFNEKIIRWKIVKCILTNKNILFDDRNEISNI